MPRPHVPSIQPQRNDDLSRAYAVCDGITREHSRTFYLSTMFLPAEKRRAVRAFYAFCRTTDDLVDMPSRAAMSTLSEWRVHAARPASEQQHPVLLAWADTRERFDVPRVYAEELIEGCETDLHVNRYATWAELRTYCYHVASTVGLISMHIIGSKDGTAETLELAKPAAIDLGVALQLTNILRDVGEDLGRNRIYLPQEDMERFGVTEGDLRLGQPSARIKHLLRFEMNRADELYDRSIPKIGLLRRDGRVAVGAAAVLYRGILGKIVLNDYDVFNRRAYLTTPEKLSRLPAVYMQLRRMDHAA